MKGPHKDDSGRPIKRKPRRSRAQKAMVDKGKEKKVLAAMERARKNGCIV